MVSVSKVRVSFVKIWTEAVRVVRFCGCQCALLRKRKGKGRQKSRMLLTYVIR